VGDEMIYLVQGDSGSQIQATITREDSGEAVDITDATTVLKFRKKGETDLIATLTTVSTAEQKSDGKAVFSFTEASLDVAEGKYEGEIEITFNSGNIETVYKILDFYIRADF
jgi:hypothetical protein